MKRLTAAILTLCLLLCACGQSTRAAWQEQYDLGMRYLDEGNYEEAILAFTAAIEIDEKLPEAYFGRGQAYYGTAALLNDGGSADFISDGDSPEEALDYCYEHAIWDYEKAIERNPEAPEYYDAVMRAARSVMSGRQPARCCNNCMSVETYRLPNSRPFVFCSSDCWCWSDSGVFL